ncbi:MAG: DUF1365 domain-containing protein [Pseudomonadota bacterium]
MNGDGALYVGNVVHARLRPQPHKLTYTVFSLAVDVDRIGAVAGRVFGLGHNRAAPVAIHDRDHGGGSEPIAIHARRVFSDAGLSDATHRIVLLTYPRVLGYVFNPISVYYGFDQSGALSGMLYEVSNTFGERKSYVLPAGDPDAQTGLYRQSCAKEMAVSPFTPGQGTYAFHISPPGDALSLGIQFRDARGAVLRTHFTGCQENLTSTCLLKQFVRTPWLSAKVSAAIHFEAAKLLLKGVPLVRRHKSPAFSVAQPSRDERR